MNAPRLLFYLLCLFLAISATVLIADPAPCGEFAPSCFPPQTEAERAFHHARELELSEPEQAVALYESLLVKEELPADAIQWALSGLLTGNRARDALETVARDETSPLRDEALEQLAEQEEARGAWAEAAALWKRRYDVLTTSDQTVERGRALTRRIHALDKAGETEKAREAAIRLWVDFAQLPEADEAGAFLARGNGDPMNPVSGKDIFRRGEKLLATGSRAKAIETLTELRRRVKAGISFLPELDLALGKAYYFSRDYEAALEVLGRASWLARQAGKPQVEIGARYYRARTLFGLNQGDEGAADLVRLAKKYSKNDSAANWLFQASKVFNGREMTAEARQARDRLMKRYPNSSHAVDIRWDDGWDAYRAGDYEAAAATFAGSVAHIRRGWQQARGLYWAARSLERAGRGEAAKKGFQDLRKRYPLGYYARLAGDRLAGRPVLRLEDARGQGGRGLNPVLPTAQDLALAGSLAQPAAYLRLGLPGAARKFLNGNGNGKANGSIQGLWLRYWSEDFKGAVRDAGCQWYQWPWENGPGAGDDACRLSFSLAYPASVEASSSEQDLHPHLLLSVARTESHFNPDGYSAWEARGLMQFIPATADRIARDLEVAGFEQEDMFQPPVAFRFGARYLRILTDKFDGDLVFAVAAYNGGESAVAKWRTRWPDAEPDEFVELIPYRETRRYVKKVLTAADAYGRLDPPGLW